MKLMWSWRTAIRMGRRMRLPAINARGLARWRAAPPDPVESRVPVVEDLNERRRVELRDHRRIHRGGGFPRREPHARFHVPINPHIGPVFHPGRRRDVREACKRHVREFRQERVPCSVPGRVDPPNPKTVVDPWWSETTSPLTWSLAQYAGSTAEGVVPSLQPASVDGGGMPATALAARRTLHTPRARVRFPPLRPARSKRRKNPI